MIQRISIHALLAESDQTVTKWASSAKISIHALLAESDLFFIVFDLFRNISIHALLAESDSPLSINCMIHMQFLSTLSLRRATMQIVIIVVDTVISIHALLAESDFMFSVVFYLENIFLSTLSLRRATTCGGGWNEQPRYFYPRSPCGERQIYQFLPSYLVHFYPRSPCGERPTTPTTAQK